MRAAIVHFRAGRLGDLLEPFLEYLRAGGEERHSSEWFGDVIYSNEFKSDRAKAMELLELVLEAEPTATMLARVALGPLDELMASGAQSEVREFSETHPGVRSAYEYWREHGY